MNERAVFNTHTYESDARSVANPFRHSATPAQVTRPAPMPGQHTRELPQEFDDDAAEIDALISQGVIGEPSAA